MHCNSSYHGLVSGGGSESGNTTIAEMVGASRSGYPRYKSEARSIGDRGGDGDGGIGGREIVEYGRTEGGRVKQLLEP